MCFPSSCSFSNLGLSDSMPLLSHFPRHRHNYQSSPPPSGESNSMNHLTVAFGCGRHLSPSPGHSLSLATDNLRQLRKLWQLYKLERSNWIFLRLNAEIHLAIRWRTLLKQHRRQSFWASELPKKRVLDLTSNAPLLKSRSYLPILLQGDRRQAVRVARLIAPRSSRLLVLSPA